MHTDHNTDESVSASDRANVNNMKVSVSDRGLLWLTAFIAGAALFGALDARRDASIATMRVEGMTRALIAHGIKDTYPHVPGEDD